ncbi:MAG: hypothetical protein IT366_24020 [Candidatus Hydrogenedentes bacterium]|nr:hypothetical protein [Candidatus Hydrogenedentota bacterium]
MNAGCKALYILAPITIKKRAENDADEAYVTIGFKTVPVFRFEDTHGAPLASGSDENKAFVDSLPLLDVARAWGISVDCFNGQHGGALGRFSYGGFTGTQSIALGVRNLSTWAHEMIHAADHRLVDLSRQSKLDKEIVAELGGATLLQCLGLDTDADLGGAYEYCKAYADAEKKQLLSVCSGLLDRVCNAVSLILETSEKTHAGAAQLCEVA